MTNEEEHNLEHELLWEAFKKRNAQPIPLAKPRMQAYISPKMAEAATANPGSIRVSARAGDGTIIVERPKTLGDVTIYNPRRADALEHVQNGGHVRRTERFSVVEVDSNGRPSVVEVHSSLDNSRGVVQFEGGFLPKGGAAHEYNPLDALDRD